MKLQQARELKEKLKTELGLNKFCGNFRTGLYALSDGRGGRRFLLVFGGAAFGKSHIVFLLPLFGQLRFAAKTAKGFFLSGWKTAPEFICGMDEEISPEMTRNISVDLNVYGASHQLSIWFRRKRNDGDVIRPIQLMTKFLRIHDRVV